MGTGRQNPAIFHDGELDELRVLVECPEAGLERAVQEAFRAELGFRVEVAGTAALAVPARAEGPAGRASPNPLVIHKEGVKTTGS